MDWKVLLLSKHRGFILSAFVALLIFAGGWFVTRPAQLDSKQQVASVGAASTTTPNDTYATQDSDQDGLPDWKERLYASDPNNPDTDGDGTQDGQEITLGRDPTIPNTAPTGKTVNDKLVLIQDPHFATSSTDVLGMKKEFFAKFLAQKSNSIRQNATLDLVAQKLDPSKIRATAQLVDLNIISDNSTDTIRQFGNDFGTVIKKYLAHPAPKESDIIKKAMAQKSQSILDELQLPAVTYRNFSNDLKLIKTPSVLSRAQLMIVEGYEGMGKSLLAIEEINVNTVQAAGGYESYAHYRLEVTEGYALIVRYFAKNGITYAPNEPGYPFYMHPVIKHPVIKKVNNP